MKTEKTIATVKVALERASAAAAGRQEIWKEKFTASCWDALVWGEDVFQATATRRTSAYLLRILDGRPEMTLAVLRESCHEEFMVRVNEVANPSSMATRNLMNVAEMVAWKWICTEVLS